MVLSCSDFKEDLSAFVDGELDQHRQTALSEHVSACSLCQSNHDGFKNVGKLLQGLHARVQDSAVDIWSDLANKLPSVCVCVQEDMSAYLDGELIAPAKEGVAQHLESCSDCLNKFNSLSQVNGLLSKGLVLPDAIEVDLWAQVKSRLNEDCVLIKSELSPFIDREVATLRHRTITQHLTECGECKGEFTALSETGEVIRTSYQPVMTEEFDLWPQIQSRMNVIPIESKEQTRRIKPTRRLYAVAAALVAGVAASVMFFYTQTNSSSSIAPVTAEAYLIDQSLGEPTDVAEAVVYEHHP
jgi:anti-sigma factor RsiW